MQKGFVVLSNKVADECPTGTTLKIAIGTRESFGMIYYRRKNGQTTTLYLKDVEQRPVEMLDLGH